MYVFGETVIWFLSSRYYFFFIFHKSNFYDFLMSPVDYLRVRSLGNINNDYEEKCCYGPMGEIKLVFFFPFAFLPS